MNTRFLETFVWLYRLRSFNRTAERLSTSQPAISGRIAALEDLLGVQLYERGVKGFELTPAGRRVIEQCERIVDLTAELRRLAGDEGALNRPLRIGSADVVSLTWLRPFLDRLSETLPDFSFEVVTDSGVNLEAFLLEDAIDIAFVVGGVDHERVRNAPIGSYRVAWIANPRHFDVSAVASIGDLVPFPIIMPPKNSAGYAWHLDYFRRHLPEFDLDDWSSRRVACGYSPATAIEMVVCGFGVMPIPVVLARAHIARGDLVELSLAEQFPPWTIAACYKSPPTIPALTALVEIAQAETKLYANSLDTPDFWP